MVSKRTVSNIHHARIALHAPHRDTSPQTPTKDRLTRVADGPLESLHRTRRNALQRPARPSATKNRSLSRKAESIARPIQPPAHTPDRAEDGRHVRGQPPASKHKRGFAALADTRTASQRRFGHASAPHGRQALRPRVESDREPTSEQMIDYGKWLNHVARAQLDEQRQDQCTSLRNLVTHARAKKVAPESCIDLARANVLAQQNGYGLALVFLDAAVPPEENTRRLDGYLLALSTASFRAPPKIRLDLLDCVDMAAHYLTKTVWFESAPLHQLANLANLLSKYSNRSACAQAVAWIAGQVLQPGQSLQLTAKLLALLTNAFSKHPASQPCEQAVAHIGLHVLDKPVQEWPPQSIGLLLNAFSKWPGNADCTTAAKYLITWLCQPDSQLQRLDGRGIATVLNAVSKWPGSATCRIAAKQLASWLSGHTGLLHALDAQGVANTLNGLCKWPEVKVCQATAEHVATRLAKDVKLQQAMNALEVANALNALSKWPDARACRIAAEHLAARLGQDAELLQSMDVQHCASALNALSKWPDSTDCETAAEHLAARLGQDDRLRQAMDGQEVATALNAVCKWPEKDACRTLAEHLAMQLVEDADLQEAMTAQHVANTLNALSKWPDNRACLTAAEHLAVWLTHDADLQQVMNALEIATTLSALSKWPDSRACRTASEHLAAHLAREAGIQQALDAQGISNALNALSKWPESGACRKAAKYLAVRLAKDVKLQQAMNVLEVANALNALSKWPESGTCRTAAEHLAARLTNEAGMRKALDARGIANVLNALSKWPDADACRTAAEHLSVRLAQDDRLRRAMDAQQMANALSALSKWPEVRVCRTATERLAERLAQDGRLRQAMTAQHVASALNALSKQPQAEACRTAAEQLAVRLGKDADLQQAMNERELANALNALSKWPESGACRTAAERLAERLAQDDQLRQAMTAQHVANALNALSKWPHAEACRTAAEHLAARLAQDGQLRQAMNAQGISSTLNALSKWPDADACRTAVERLAERLTQDEPLRNALDGQGVSNTLNALSKWPDAGACRAAAEDLAARLVEDAALRRAMTAQHVANALGALGKWPDAGMCRTAVEHLAARLAEDAELQQAMDVKGIASALNTLCKRPESAPCRTAAEHLAVRLGGDADLRQAMTDQQVATTLNALSKWPDASAFRTAAEQLAERLACDDRLRQTMDAQGVANTLNALGKWPEANACRAAAEHMATRLARDTGLQQAMNTQAIASALSALSKWPENESCQEAAVSLAETLGIGGRPFATFSMGELGQLANGMGRFSLVMGGLMAGEDPGTPDASPLGLMHARLRELAAHLNVRHGGLDTADTLDVAIIFKALASARLKDCLKLLASQGLQRLLNLHAQTRFRRDNLETLGNLAAGLLPLVRSPELKTFRTDTLRLLERIQPDVASKAQSYIETHLAPAAPTQGDRIAKDEAFGTRRPGLTFFLLLKTYDVVAGLWKMRNVADDRARVTSRREELKAWVGNLLEQVRESVEGDLDEMSWNLIAQIEAGDHVLDTLDLKLWRDLDKIITKHPSTQLDVAAVRRELRNQPEVRDLMSGESGAATLQIIDIRGHNAKAGADGAALAQYSFFTRLTGGQIPLIEVELPGKLGAFMLARTIQRDGDLLRMDLFGGSHLTPPTTRVFEQLAGARSAKRYGRIPAIRLADTAPRAPLMRDVIRKLNPQREDWYRMQRALLEVVPRDHVVEGPVRLSLLADRLQGAEPAFALRTPAGEPIRLVSHDGCGFIKESLACRIPAMAQAMEAWRLSRRKKVPDQAPALRMSPLPAQATHHYPRDEAVIEEVRKHLRQSLHTDTALWETDASGGARKLSKAKLYDLLTCAGITGVQGIAVPSADDKLYLPGETGGPFDRAGGPVLLGKPPYDKPNLIPVPAERVGTSKQGDVTARFLETAFAFQYSYTAWDESRTAAIGDADDAPMLHGKGVTIVVPDALWPQDNDAQWVWSTEDMKIHSSWTQRRERDRLPAHMDTVGSLRLKDIFAPGALIAVPIDELKKRDADCDGDKVFVYAGLPKMAQAISTFFDDRERQVGKAPSFKPPKTASTAFDEAGRYQAGRAAEVLSAVSGQDLVRRMSTLQFHFWGQPQALRERIAEYAIFGTYEGTRRELRRGLNRLLYNPAEATSAQLQELRERARLGEQYALHPVARDAAQALRSQLEAFANDLQNTRDDAAQPQALAPALAQRFTALADAYAQAQTPRERLAALVEHYPSALLPHPGTTLPKERPSGTDSPPKPPLGYQPGAPLETLRNLLTLGVKVGTDAPKAVTQTDVYLKVADRLDRALRNEPDRIRSIPYTKSGLLPKLRDGLDAETELKRLHDNPTLAAGLMEMALKELQEHGLLEGAPAPGDVSTDIEARLRQLARSLHSAAAHAEAHVTNVVRNAIHGIGVLRGDANRLKSEQSLFGKLCNLMQRERLTPDEAAAGVHDALRYSIVQPPETFAQGYTDILGKLDIHGVTRVRVRNSFVKPHTAFKGIHVGLMGRDADGKTVRLEIQFHTPQTFDLKERFHDDYKRAQSLSLAGASYEQQQTLLAAARDGFDAIAMPPGCERIIDWDSEPPLTHRLRATTTAAHTDPKGSIERIAAQARTVRREVGPLLEAIGLAIVKHHSVPKQAASIGKKIQRYQVLKGLSPDLAEARIRDAMRWVVLLPVERFAAEFEQTRQALEKAGLRVMRINNGFVAADTTYAGLNATLRSAGGLDFEMQFHTVDSLRARNTSHKAYRKLQGQEVDAMLERDPGKRLSLQQSNAQLLLELKERAAEVPRPQGVVDIASFNRYPDADAGGGASNKPQRAQGHPSAERKPAIARQPHPTLSQGRRSSMPTLEVKAEVKVEAEVKTEVKAEVEVAGNPILQEIAASLAPQWIALRQELAGTGIAPGPMQPARLGEQLTVIQRGLEHKTLQDLLDLAGNPGLRLDWARREPLYEAVVVAVAALGLATQQREHPLYDALRELDVRGGLRQSDIDRRFRVGVASGERNICLFDSLHQLIMHSGNGMQRLQGLLGDARIDSGAAFGRYMQHLMHRGGLLRAVPAGHFDQMDFSATSVVMTALANLLDLRIVFLHRQVDGTVHLSPPVGNSGAHTVFLQRETAGGADGHFRPLWLA
ncbi:XopAD/skwp family type III secretion system effector [Ralstonia solanacearum]|uniref:XopAD/skwp family type III secretion system effector n=1 Tax=Ralstonia solanacearum TaxID=305 RepID=UPI001E5A3D6C|nr:XopAD/skwp family type III secretion system effector [Ralstonia solanacearum]